MGFVAVTQRCLGCRAAMPKGVSAALCASCEPRQPEVYYSKLQAYAQAEAAFHTTLVMCQRITGDNYKDIVGIPRDSPVYYKMKKVRKDLREAEEVLARFGTGW